VTRRAVLIGAGGIAGAHVDAVRYNHQAVDLVAVCDIDAGRAREFATTHAIDAAYADVELMLAREQPDLALICTPPGTHCALICAALEAGAWVLCEKPLCASLAEMDAIEAAEAKSGCYCSSVFQWRFGAGGRHLHRLIAAGKLGRPLVGTCLTTWYRTAAYYAVPWRGKWQTELGGVTMGHGIHAIDFFLWLYGQWQEVRAMVGTLVHQIEVEDVSMAMVRFENGAMGSICNSVLSPREESYLRFDFEQATVELTHLYRYRNADWRYAMPAHLADDARLARWRAIDGDDTPDPHGLQLRAILDCMDRNERPPVSGPDVRGTIEFLASMYKAAFTGQPVRHGSIMSGDPFYHRMCGTFGK
jgi:predicted dehydrogenase